MLSLLQEYRIYLKMEDRCLNTVDSYERDIRNYFRTLMMSHKLEDAKLEHLRDFLLKWNYGIANGRKFGWFQA